MTPRRGRVAHARATARSWQWDKDDLQRSGFDQTIDLLGLGMLSLLRDAFAAAHATVIPERPVLLARIDPNRRTKPTYEMLCTGADFDRRVPSRVARPRTSNRLLPRLKPVCFYDRRKTGWH